MSRLVFVLAICCATLPQVVYSQESDREVLEKFFMPDLADDDGSKVNPQSIDVGGAKIRICRPRDQVPSRPGPGNRPVCMAIKIWGEIVEGPNRGKLVNLDKYKWQRREKFRLHVSSAFDVTMAVFQVFPENNPPAVQVSPLKQYPETFSTIPRCKDYVLPFLFETDDNLVDETVQFVFARGESRRCPLHAISSNGSVVKDIDGVDEIVSKGFAKLRDEQESDSGSKLRVVPASSPTPISNSFSDVSVIMVGDGSVHLGQVILHKD